jgi:hypothetical protein
MSTKEPIDGIGCLALWLAVLCAAMVVYSAFTDQPPMEIRFNMQIKSERTP